MLCVCVLLYGHYILTSIISLCVVAQVMMSPPKLWNARVAVGYHAKHLNNKKGLCVFLSSWYFRGGSCRPVRLLSNSFFPEDALNVAKHSQTSHKASDLSKVCSSVYLWSFTLDVVLLCCWILSYTWVSCRSLPRETFHWSDVALSKLGIWSSQLCFI